MLARTRTSTLVGVSAVAVDVEVRTHSAQKPYFSIIGLGDIAVRESRERVTSAIRHCGYELPTGILVNLAPAELRKSGSAFDLAIALGILASSGQLRSKQLSNLRVHGELALDGRIKSIRGAVAYAIGTRKDAAGKLVVPIQNLHEAQLISGIDVVGVASLSELFAYISEGKFPEHPIRQSAPALATTGVQPCLSEVIGQISAKRALAVAAAGGHNLLMIGPPGCGKSMLAARFPYLLPRLREEEMLATALIFSVAGLPVEPILSGIRPFRAPHHIVSDVGLIGGGPHLRPGEISLAHNGVLFLDEFPEFRRSAIEGLRAPLESGVVSITRAKGTVEYPAHFQLVAAMNPCPCGRLGAAGKGCHCSRPAIQRYLHKLSRPILDRIDLQVELEPVPVEELHARFSEPEQARQSEELSTEYIREEVSRLHALQIERQGKLNEGLDIADLHRYGLDQEALAMLNRAAGKRHLSVRSCVRTLRVARTIADFNKSNTVKVSHVAEALNYRSFDRLEEYSRGEQGISQAGGM